MKLVLTIIFVFNFFFSFSQGKIIGHIIDSTTKKPIIGAKVTLLTIKNIKLDTTYNLIDLSANDKSGPIVYFDTTWNRGIYTYTDSLGYYQIDSIPSDYYKVHSFFKIKEERGLLIGEYEVSDLIRVIGSQQHRIDFQLGVFCTYDVTKDLDQCPNCHKKEGVRIQVYGLPANINNLREDNGIHYYNGFCVIQRCQPTKICILCKTEF